MKVSQKYIFFNKKEYKITAIYDGTGKPKGSFERCTLYERAKPEPCIYSDGKTYWITAYEIFENEKELPRGQ